MIKILILILNILVICNGESLLHEKGGTTFASAKIPLSAKSQAMGGAGVAAIDDGAYSTINPALISTIENDNIYLEHINFYQQMNIEFLNTTLLYKHFPIGVSLQYFNLGYGPITDEVGSNYTENNNFHAYDGAITISSRFNYKKAAIGFAVKAIQEAVWDKTINGLALDLGIVMPTPVKDLTAGASLINLGSSGTFIDKAYPLTSMLRLGAAYKHEVNDNVGVSSMLDINASNDKTLTIPAGMELRYKSLSMRGGYNFLHDTRSFSAGFGFTFGTITLDYCYIHFIDDFNSNGRPHFFALSFVI